MSDSKILIVMFSPVTHQSSLSTPTKSLLGCPDTLMFKMKQLFLQNFIVDSQLRLLLEFLISNSLVITIELFLMKWRVHFQHVCPLLYPKVHCIGQIVKRWDARVDEVREAEIDKTYNTLKSRTDHLVHLQSAQQLDDIGSIIYPHFADVEYEAQRA